MTQASPSSCHRLHRPPRCISFFDLPPELRNYVYELSGIEHANRRLDFSSSPLKNRPTATLPAMLRADDRLLVEAGSYYFPIGAFDIQLDWKNTRPLSQWFAAIGAVNQTRMVKNGSVMLRFLHDAAASCRAEGCYNTRRPSLRLLLDRVPGYPGPSLEGLQLRTTYPEMALWRTECGCPRGTKARIEPLPEKEIPKACISEVHPSVLFVADRARERKKVVERAEATLGSLRRVMEESRRIKG